MLEPQVLGARGMYLNGALEPALRKAQEILRHTPDDFNVHLLICRCVNARAYVRECVRACVSARMFANARPMGHPSCITNTPEQRDRVSCCCCCYCCPYIADQAAAHSPSCPVQQH